MTLKRIVTGGQTGADRAALDAARAWRLPIGGWIPAHRGAEDGAVPAEFVEMSETESADPAARTRLNVLDSDGTLIISHGPLTGGSDLTFKVAKQLQKPALHLDLREVGVSRAVRDVATWIRCNHVETLNVAGPRASEDPAVYQATFALISGVLACVTQ